jgi:nicotinate-nucleotide pyrophosphorylase (carboxylating)
MNEGYLQEKLKDFLRSALNEDIGSGDHTTLATIPEFALGSAKLLVKDQGILAGIEIAETLTALFDDRLQMEVFHPDGARVEYGQVAFHLHGPSRSITTVERVLLNVMQRMSGIATVTNRIQNKIAHTGCKLLDTRKTTPGFRYFEKLAVHIGGGENHRFGLYDMILIKDNHVDFAGGMSQALEQVNNYLHTNQLQLKIEAEARNLSEVEAILESGIVFRILLDNFKPQDLQRAVEYIGDRALTEASGGIDEDNVLEYAESGVNYISMGALTHRVRSLDLSLKAIHLS